MIGRFAGAWLVIAVLGCHAFAEDDSLADALVKWDTQCSKPGCLMQTDILRGWSGDPPDAKDFREYVGLAVAVDRETRRPRYFTFHVDPRAQRQSGILVAFTKTVPKGRSWNILIDRDGVVRLPALVCGENSCMVRVPLGLVGRPGTGRPLDLLEKFLHSNHMLMLYVRNGHRYRTMVLLASFRKEYQRILSQELSAAATK